MAGFKTKSELIWGSPENDRFREAGGLASHPTASCPRHSIRSPFRQDCTPTPQALMAVTTAEMRRRAASHLGH
jgi:hypothetical protein